MMSKIYVALISVLLGLAAIMLNLAQNENKLFNELGLATDRMANLDDASIFVSQQLSRAVYHGRTLSQQQSRADGRPSNQSGSQQPEFNPRRLMDPMPPIKKIPTQSIEKANRTLGPAELVLGVEVDGQARAYPITMLCGPRREIINDTLGNLAIAATW